MYVFSYMSARPSKGALAKVSAKNPFAAMNKHHQFNVHRATEKGKSGETSATTTPARPFIHAPPTPSIMDLEAGLDTLPNFDDCVANLLRYRPDEKSDKGKVRTPPSLLKDVDTAIGLLSSILSNEDLDSFKGTSFASLAKGILLGKVSVDVGHPFLFIIFMLCLLTILFVFCRS